VQGDIEMKRIAIAIIASGVVAASAVHANPYDQTVVVPPTDLPELARQSGDAMLLHEGPGSRPLM
jgi:hypothetical protein